MFKIEINTGGAAFCNPLTGKEDAVFENLEITRILENIIHKLKYDKDSGTILDINGNVVGRWEKS